MEKLVINNEELFGQVVELLREGRQVTIPVKGASMLPFIREEQDLVVLEGFEKQGKAGSSYGVRRGDIVLFRYSGKYIMHRVLRVSEGMAFIQGDGVLKGKEKCGLQDVYGRVVKILRNGVKEVDPSSCAQRFLWNLWLLFLPLRRYFLGIYRRWPRKDANC